ncbi:RagB/SusD family nutrient uptake outer membrane protein [Parapedobacter koreensis]|uniref:SusD family protein n=1 Tax=Parapedobacter koreensis TaxID=332977 RepID=A0A1H7HW92_9SPHI|nr:RagB/SusD family nutrient uptake outer membrane protein [Parapedobacter koreensis]SEK53877.1 SusD family protein [Parapedobacter koreensis]
MKIKNLFLCLAACALLFCRCNSYLDVKPDKQLVIPETLADLQALLDNYSNVHWDPYIGEVSSDDYYLADTDWSALSDERDRRRYLWEKEGIYPSLSNDWFWPYRNVYYANVVLETLDRIGKGQTNPPDWDHIRGQALFLRARSFLSVALLFSKSYDSSTAATDLGIPIRLSSDFNIQSERASLKDTYTQITEDLVAATEVLPNTPLHVYRASKPAAMALLARMYLFMRDYEKCLYYADACLKLKSDLIDYNTLDSNANFPIPEFNDEIIYQSITYATPLANNRAKIDSILLDSYQEGDLRKRIFFRVNVDGSSGFKGSYYSASNNLFSGIAVDEVYLMRAECHARLGNLEMALADLNTLLAKRWSDEKFIPLIDDSQDTILATVLTERRKELLMRAIRWPDVKRLNMEGFDISFERRIGDEVYTLAPNGPRFIFPIPDDVIELTGMPQNP